jgi:hypothetical protein
MANYTMSKSEGRTWKSRDSSQRITTRAAVIAEARRRADEAGAACEVMNADGVVAPGRGDP